MDEYLDSEEHIYENVVSSNRYKYNKILNGILNSFSLKKRDIPPPTPPITPPPPPPQQSSITKTTSTEQSLLPTMMDYDDNMNSCEFYVNSYTSCEDDNIYENLEFFDAYDDSKFMHTDSAIDEWMRNLAYEIEDYETDNFIFIKSIPSVLQTTSVITHRNISKSELTTNFLKALWREDRIGMMSFLLETFSSLLRIQSQVTTTAVADIKSSSFVQKKKFKKRPQRCEGDNYRKKLENVILSSSLNALMITYNQSLKFYFALSQRCEAFSSRLSLSDVSSSEAFVVTIRKHFKFIFHSRSDRREFYRTLELILARKLSEINQLKTVVVKYRENRESIYQPIWTCQSSNKRSALILNENIYAQLVPSECSASVDDDNEWEIDDEFSFVTSIVINNDKMMTTSASSEFRRVWIFHSDNVEQNKIVYDQESFMHSLNTPVVHSSECLEQEHKIVNREEMIIDEKYLAPVEAWKLQLRVPCFVEDEEDFIVNDSILTSNFCSSSSSSNNSSNDSLESGLLSKSIYDDAMSTSMQFDDNLSMAKSMESFVSASNDDLDSYRGKSPSDTSPKGRFRDRIASKLGFPSSRKVNVSDNSLNSSIKSTEDEENERHKVFGCYLEFVEKDGYYKDIPKFVVECVKYIEFESNLKTAGIYRISGNKTIMDALKKKLNEKKSPKKESKYLCLQEQDVHTLTGLVKMFFRELQSSLMSKAVFAMCTSEKLSASEMKEKLKEMPMNNYALLKYLFKHFKSIERYEKENLMNSGNIAICWGLCLFHNEKEDFNPLNVDLSKCNMLCKFLIDNYREVFE